MLLTKKAPKTNTRHANARVSNRSKFMYVNMFYMKSSNCIWANIKKALLRYETFYILIEYVLYLQLRFFYYSDSESSVIYRNHIGNN